MMCNEIETRLPAYLENVLSPEEKQNIEVHLDSCPRCSDAFETLKKAQGIVQGLTEVEPPPFFEQRIMARVREEAEQKPGMLRKLFYPLYIKVPIQAFATLLIAVMAFSIYRTIMPELKDLAPPAMTVPEPAKDQTTAKSLKTPAAPTAVTPVMKAPEADLSDKKKQGFAAAPIGMGAKTDRMAGFLSPLQEERMSVAKPAAPAMAPGEKESLPLRTEALSRIQDRAVKQEAAQSLETARPEDTRKGKMSPIGAASAPSLATDAVIQRPAVHLTLHVRDVPFAVREIEERIGQVNGRVIEKQRRDASAFLKAEIAVRHLAAFLHGMEAIGWMKVEKSPHDVSEGKVTVNMEIAKEP